MHNRNFFSHFWVKLIGFFLILLLLSAFIKPKEREISHARFDSVGMGSSIHLLVGTQGLPGAYQQLEEMNIHWVREEIPWQEVEQIPGQFQWNYANGDTIRDYHFMLDEAEKHGLEVLAVLSGGPVYLPHVYPEKSVDIDLFLEHWKNYVQAVVDRFGDQIDYWEISPQANRPDVWGAAMFPTTPGAVSEPNAFLYSRMLTTANKIIKKHNKSDTIVLGGLYGSMSNSCLTSPLMFLKEIKNNGAWKAFDVIAIHPYWENNPPEAWIPRGAQVDPETLECNPNNSGGSNLVHELRTIRDFAQSNGRKPVWVTEIGWHETWLSYSADQHQLAYDQVEANYLTRSIVPLISEKGIEKIFWFTLYEDPASPGFVLGPNGQQALKNLSRLLGGARALGQFQQTSSYGTAQDLGIYEFRFRKEGRTIIIAWTASGGQSPYLVTFEDIPGKRYRAYAADALDLSVDAGMELSVNDNKSMTIYVNEFPVILIEQNPSLVSSLSQRMKDGVNKTIDDQKDKAQSWASAQMNNLTKEMLDWVEQKMYGLLNKSFDKLEDSLSLGNE